MILRNNMQQLFTKVKDDMLSYASQGIDYYFHAEGVLYSSFQTKDGVLSFPCGISYPLSLPILNKYIIEQLCFGLDEITSLVNARNYSSLDAKYQIMLEQNYYQVEEISTSYVNISDEEYNTLVNLLNEASEYVKLPDNYYTYGKITIITKDGVTKTCYFPMLYH